MPDGSGTVPSLNPGKELLSIAIRAWQNLQSPELANEEFSSERLVFEAITAASPGSAETGTTPNASLLS